jgi:hypothetical protein
MPINLKGPVDEAVKELASLWRDRIFEGVNPPLAASTVASKMAKGSPYPDLPLVDTMLMVESIESSVDEVGENEVRGWVGIQHPSRADIATYHEFGLGVPERPSLRPIVDENADRLLGEIFDKFFKQVEDQFYKK